MLESDYAMVKNGNCDYKLTVAYDTDPDGISLVEEIQSLLSEMFNIAESYNCSMEADIYEVGGPQRSWYNQSSVQCSFFNLAKIAASARRGLIVELPTDRGGRAGGLVDRKESVRERR